MNFELLSIVVISALFVCIAAGAGWWMKYQSKKKEAARKRRLQKRNVHFAKDAGRRPRIHETIDSHRSETILENQRAQDAAAKSAKLAEERSLVEPELELLRELRTRPLSEVSLDDIRRLLTYDATDVDFTEHISEEERVWLYGTYEQLAPDELVRLVENAIEGSAEDYRQALDLRRESLDFVGYDVEEHPELVSRWDRMIMRHVSNPDWDDILGWSGYDNDLPALYENAKNDDFFSIRLVLMLMEKGEEDEAIVEYIVDEFREKMNYAFEAHRPSFTD